VVKRSLPYNSENQHRIASAVQQQELVAGSPAS
jgi:hypothetical protein